MKKSVFLLALALVVLVVWCWKKDKIDITDNNIDVEICDKYFELMNCVLENDGDETYTEEMRKELKQEIKDVQAEWELLEQDELHEKCSAGFNKFYEIEDRLNEIWCPIK